ncbi:hypothetical protein ABZP36_024471 [Zizania latifolia]
MSARIKAVVDRFVRELKEALDAHIQGRIMKEHETQILISMEGRAIPPRVATMSMSFQFLGMLNKYIAEIALQGARLTIERENLEKEKSALMGTASSQDNQDGEP